MARKDVQRAARQLAKRQHWVVTRVQLLALGFTRNEIEHRIESGRLHPIWPGIYAVDRPDLTQEGRFSAAVSRVRRRRGSESPERRDPLGTAPRACADDRSVSSPR